MNKALGRAYSKIKKRETSENHIVLNDISRPISFERFLYLSHVK